MNNLPPVPADAPKLALAGALEAEFDMLMARAGLSIPADLRPSLLAGFADLRAMLPLLRQPRSAAAEPSNVFRLAKLEG